MSDELIKCRLLTRSGNFLMDLEIGSEKPVGTYVKQVKASLKLPDNIPLVSLFQVIHENIEETVGEFMQNRHTTDHDHLEVRLAAEDWVPVNTEDCNIDRPHVTEVVPNAGSVDGGDVVHLHGVKFEERNDILIMFGRIPTKATYVSQHEVIVC
eukprot:TRINITY_DN285_c0_g1_i2.p2 TRINITY_DN285_c0_g1~~TRINITY_DN285_c0_g1_i2.p2  ORF type:complete len:154 (+),score=30.38 TRINITY_DN285_c0_g1_i2:49-510(+)